MRRIIFEKALKATPAHSHGASKALLSRHHLEEMVEQRTKELQMALKRIGKTYDDTLETLAAALDLRDSETASQSRPHIGCRLLLANRNSCYNWGHEASGLFSRSEEDTASLHSPSHLVC